MSNIEDNNVSPEFNRPTFTCPHCKVLATQDWASDKEMLGYLENYIKESYNVYKSLNVKHFNEIMIICYRIIGIENWHASLAKHRNLSSSRCASCTNFSIWLDKKMIYPLVSSAPEPSKDMPDDVKKVYEEARQVEPYSPRASAALLRVALEKLTVHLGEKEGNINTRIKNLKNRGLSEQVIKGLDTLRIFGNEGGAHSGKIDLEGKDNKDIVTGLFRLVNYIITRTITESKEVKSIYNKIPEDKREGINNRDNK